MNLFVDLLICVCIYYICIYLRVYYLFVYVFVYSFQSRVCCPLLQLGFWRTQGLLNFLLPEFFQIRFMSRRKSVFTSLFTIAILSTTFMAVFFLSFRVYKSCPMLEIEVSLFDCYSCKTPKRECIVFWGLSFIITRLSLSCLK